MKETIVQLIAFGITGFLFMNLSITFGWSIKIWNLLNKKLNPQYNIVIWIISAGVLTILVQLLCEMMGLANIKLIKGCVLGIYLAAMPNINKNI